MSNSKNKREVPIYLTTITNPQHSDSEIDHWLSQTTSNIRHALSLAYAVVNRHASDTRIGLMDSTVSVEALVNGAPPSPLGDAYL